MLGRALFRIRFEVWQVLSHQRRDKRLPLQGGFLAPYPGQPYMHTLNIHAWVLADTASSLRFDLRLGGRVVHAGTTGGGSPDDAALFAGGTFRHHIRRTLGPRELQERSGRLLSLSVYSGERASTVAVTPVRRVRRVPRGMPRSEYATVWDSVSRNRTAARIAVTGFADEGEWQRSGQSTADYVVRSLGITPEDRVLEIGCGTGRVGMHVAPRCRHWTGADVSENMIRHARQDLARHGNVDFVRLNGYDLYGIADGSYDAVYCSAVFMHLDEWDRFRYVQEAMRVLRAGGRLFVDNFNLLGEDGWRFFEENGALDVAVRPPHVSRSSTPQELHKYLSVAGFTDIRLEEGSLFVTAIGHKPGERLGPAPHTERA